MARSSRSLRPAASFSSRPAQPGPFCGIVTRSSGSQVFGRVCLKYAAPYQMLCVAKDSQGMQPKLLLQLQEGNHDVRAVSEKKESLVYVHAT